MAKKVNNFFSLDKLVDFLGKNEYKLKRIPSPVIMPKNSQDINEWLILGRKDRVYIRQSEEQGELIDKVNEFIQYNKIPFTTYENKGGLYSINVPSNLEPSRINLYFDFSADKITSLETPENYLKYLEYINKKKDEIREKISEYNLP